MPKKNPILPCIRSKNRGGIVKRQIFFFIMICFLISSWAVICSGETIQGETANGILTQNKPANGGGTNWGLFLGLHSTFFQMQRNRGEIFRNINWLAEEQNYWPYKPMVQVTFPNFFALELDYDHFKAAALNRAFDIYPEHDRRWSDGYLEWAPLMVAFQIHPPKIHRAIDPYVLGGISYTKTSWKRNDWYYYGFPSLEVYNQWTAQGNNPEEYSWDGYRRIFAVDDHCIGTLLGFGVNYFIKKNIVLNLNWRYHWARVNFTYTLASDGGRAPFSIERGVFYLDSWILGLGLFYFF
jgi:hypothetical protein